MALGNEQALPITGFKGLDKSLAVPEQGYTRSLLNVRVREGKVTGRGGVTFDSTFGTAMSENIRNLMPYTDSSTLAVTLLRIGTTVVEKSTNGGAWSDITGTALNGQSTDRPQWANFRGTLYFTNEGNDLPRSWTGSGNTTVIASSTSPKCKGIMSYYGFLFLLHIFDSSTSAFAPRRAQYSETPDTDWTACAGNLLNFDETPGALLAGIPIGDTAAMLKEDGVVILRWVGGNVRFVQKLLKGAPGTLAPLAAQPIQGEGCIYLGDDYELYMADANQFQPLPPRVNDILQNDLYKASVADCRSCIIKGEELYSLFFPLDSTGNWGRINYEYRSGEFTYDTYTGHQWDAVQTVRWTKTAAESVIGVDDTQTFTLDTTAKDDNQSASTSKTPSRYIDTDWLQFVNSNEGRIVHTAATLTGATLVFEANPYTKCKVSVALDHKNTFSFNKTYDLRPKHAGDEYVWVRYDIPPMECEWFNLRIELFNSTTQKAKLMSGAIHVLSDGVKRDIRRSASTSEA